MVSVDGATKKQVIRAESDSSETEGALARIGEVPLEWYKNFNHIGYNVRGKKVERRIEKLDIKKQLKMAKHNKFYQ
ncbi:hypothetical protein MHBO_003780 [Bonamia ostreae]|uniref:LAGLIDADG homing endonuclease n=1 Tax=Bonamia ostreae TaxID=126728 RepID=A0ABV2ARK2_9EUKA